MKAWSYSHLDSFATCPKKFFHTKVAYDIVEPPGEAAEWGVKVHTAFENATLHGTALPEGMTQWQGIADKYNALPGEKLVEYAYAITKDFRPTEWKSKDAWSRGKADLTVIHGSTALTVDWKTGKRKPTEQLDLYAAYVHHHFPQVKVVHTHFVWLKERKIDKAKREIAEVPIIWQSLLPRVRRLELAHENNSWPARPSGLCNGWCPVKTCVHWKEKRK